jgi:hypothetical protein
MIWQRCGLMTIILYTLYSFSDLRPDSETRLLIPVERPEGCLHGELFKGRRARDLTVSSCHHTTNIGTHPSFTDLLDWAIAAAARLTPADSNEPEAPGIGIDREGEGREFG